MSVIEKKHETYLLQELPPHARDIADFLFNSKTLTFFLQQWQQPNTDKELLAAKKVPEALWPQIIEAGLLAKLTFMEPQPGLTSEQLLFLIHISCRLVKMPLSQYSLEEVVHSYQENMPRYTKWLIQMTQTLRQSKNKST